ncbi:hypothetical protein [Methanoculleus sp.]|jgi:hypothetical protein|uniref:hypothetical protein n=1 Tax=Methanoculleus sp. TaxID=90427 RepID=UPI001BD517DF|nr:hypothetical protein [Methanoculleus sp.]
MRTNLQGLAGRRVELIAVFWQYGTYRGNGCCGKSILLRHVRDLSGRLLADHIWINYTAGFDAAGEFCRGDIVRFTAKVDEYVKGYLGAKIDDRLLRPPAVDYCLKFPRRVEMIGRVGQGACPVLR